MQKGSKPLLFDKALHTRDISDPQELGQQLFNRPKHIPVEKMADMLDKEYARRKREALDSQGE